MIYIGDVAIDFGQNEFLVPYLLRALDAEPDTVLDTPSGPVTAMVRIVTDDTSPEGSGRGRPSSQSHVDAPLSPSTPVATLRCPHIVGTGMVGLPRRIAELIYSGRYVHVRGNEARISVVHAVDVARAVVLAAETYGDYVLTDGTDPTIHDLAEALAYRIDQKRLFTIAPRWARLWYGRQRYTTLTTDHVVADTFCETFPDFCPVDVVDYLHTHDYDQQSL